MEQPLNRGRNDSKDKTNWNDPIWTTKRVQILRQGPCDGVTVQALNRLTAPDVRSSGANKDFPLRIYDGNHNN